MRAAAAAALSEEVPPLGLASWMMAELSGRRVRLRALRPEDFAQWQLVRERSRDWLTPWEPRPAGTPHLAEDRAAFVSRCQMRERERQLGIGYGFGIFVGGELAGEINLSAIQRGSFQNAYVGYWIDVAKAGNGYVPEACAVLFAFAFEDLGLHRLQIAIVPRNAPSRRVVRKLGLRGEGIACRYLEINGRWEDHVRYAITAEEWAERGAQLREEWIGG